VVVHVLDRVLNGEDVARPRLVDAVDDGGQVVDFPEPVGPVTSTNPRGRLASHSAVGGRSSSVKLGTRRGSSGAPGRSRPSG
jgi:hypothetical protein